MVTLSVVIPVYNEEKRIGVCLESLLAQTRPADEIVIVDNGSTDSSGEVIDRYRADHPEIRVITQTTPGLQAARRTGFDAATSQFIARTDADSVVATDWVQRILDFFDDETGREFAAVSGLTLPSDGPARDILHKVALVGMGKRKDGGEYQGIAGPNCALRAEAWNRAKSHLVDRVDTWEDLDLALALNECGLKKYFLPTMLVDTSMRQSRHSPWENRRYLTGGIRTARAHGDSAAVRMMYVDLPFRIVTFTLLWLVFRPWDDEKRNWRPWRLVTPLERERELSTTNRETK
uniref:glycosyltransferase n=1 Tax=Gordonia sp. B7-2 TaxID=3420932 RepID=UPI003D8F3EA1